MADITLTGDQDIDLSGEAGTDGNSRNTNDTITGGEGDNTIVAGPDTQVTETETVGSVKNPQTQTYDVQDNDTIIESSGDNTLTGGYGNDTFKFVINFDLDIQQHTETFAAPTQTSGANTNGVWNSWLDSLEAWQAQMEATYGEDESSATTTTSYTYGAKNKQTGSMTYDNSFTWSEETVTTNTSTNMITDFGNGNDDIVLAGVTADQFAQYGHLQDDGAGNVVITIGSFSITVAGADMLSVASHLTFA